MPTTTRATRLRLLARASALGLLALAAWPAAADAANPRSQEYLASAQERLAEGDLRAALIELRNAVQADPSNLQARQALGEVYLQVGDFDGAEKEFERVRSARPDDRAAALGLARALMATNRPNQALDVLGPVPDGVAASERRELRAQAQLALNRVDDAAATLAPALEAEPERPSLNLLQARIEAARGETERARDRLDAMLGRDPRDQAARVLLGQIALSQGELRETDRLAEAVLEQGPNLSAERLLAEVSLRRGDLPQTEARARAILERRPNDIRAVYLLASAQAADGRYGEADRTLRQVSSLLRANPYAPLTLLSGAVKAGLGQPAQARQLLNRYLVDQPDSLTGRRLLAGVELTENNPESAREALQPLVDAGTPDITTLQLYSSAQLRVGDYEGARATFERLARIGDGGVARQANDFLNLLDQSEGDPELRQATLLAFDDLRNARPDEALRRADALVRERPNDLGARNLLAVVRIARGEDEAARDQLETALEIDPTFEEAQNNLDRLDLRAGEIERLERRLRERIAADPTDDDPPRRLARLLVRDGRLDEAEAVLTRALERRPDSVTLRVDLANRHLARNEPTQALAVADQLRLLDNPEALTAAGRIYLGLNRAEAAAEAYGALVEARPEDAGALLALARSQYVAGNAEGARATLERLREQDPGNLVANNSLIDLDLQAGNIPDALVFAREVETVDPEQALLLQAKVLLAAERVEDTIKLLDGALERVPTSAIARTLFLTRYRSGRQDEALDALRGWLEENPGDIVNVNTLSQALMAQGDYREASSLLERSLQLVPNDPELLNNLAWLRHELDRPGAIELAQRALRVSGNVPEIMDTFAWILVERGRADEALPLLREADQRTEGTNPDIRYHLAYALNETGNKEEARRLLERILADGTPFYERDGAERLLSELRAS